VVLEQRVRPDAQDTLAFFAEQDVAVKVISGDNARSVGAVTSGLGLVGGADALDARTLSKDPYVDAEGAPTERFTDAVARHTVFGRVTPDQKRSMVDALKERGHTVAMTGDGVNDVLALKQADIGVSMGSGSPATRAVAQIVLLDNRFATLPYVVAEGRRVIGNIERVANLFLTKTVYSVLLALVVGLWQLPFPLQPIHVTITGWFTIGVPAFLLSLAPNHERAQPGFAKRVLALAVPSGVIVAVATFTSYLLARAAALPPGTSGQAAVPEELRLRIATATLATLIVAATWVLAVVARPYEWWKVGLIALSAAAYLLIFSWPLTARFFLLDASDAGLMTRALLIGVVAAAFVEIGWWVQQRRSANPRRFWATSD
jgi:cation-transporting ATPase E